MHKINVMNLTAKERYKLLSGTVIPRPIAFVTTRSTESGKTNAAPFSFFSMLAGDPPLLSIAVGRKKGMMKDTARNAVASKELVIHVVHEDLVSDMNQTAATLKPEESEVDLTSLSLVESTSIQVPGIKEALVRFECQLESHLPIQNDEGEVSFDLLIARVIVIHLDETVYNKEKNYVLPDKLKPVARLSGPNYAGLGEFFSLKRPD
ncbi:flavin reductase family protein [Shouchella hunanensis]|uniref:Flavin reductase family protein n=1 Tax=Shouchella hunanensis TaxID=766894 RepID=A0ABY7WEU7_9BACI|nr:flavin reductase family protein [Shouchella hunanensis]RQW18993.1 flavin reductase family protein [Bacillus sp. C1-1]WDF05190.1 flavin reductase family protein [Shouchella hunanensis]